MKMQWTFVRAALFVNGVALIAWYLISGSNAPLWIGIGLYAALTAVAAIGYRRERQ